MSDILITTPIYYVNAKPHIGHGYCTIATDVFARYFRIRGHHVHFLTGTDEHGVNIERKAKDEALEPQKYVDSIAPLFVDAAKALGCEPDDFIRTTEPRHKAAVSELWKRLEAKGDIYLGHYEAWYCASCESFYTEKDLTEPDASGARHCKIHKKPVERIKEESYFFKLSSYQDKLLEYYKDHPEFVTPEGRFNEVKRFVEEGLRDLSISRTSFRWGIPVPGHPDHVMYVWLDALTNYLSATGGPAANEADEKEAYKKYWLLRNDKAQRGSTNPNTRVIHILGKEILRFHAVYWPAFLMSAGLPLPDAIFAHGWLTIDGEKMSKTAGNVVSPEALSQVFGADVARYYFMREIAFGQDGDFAPKNVLARYHGELGNGLGNLLNRSLPFVIKQFDGKVPAPDASLYARPNEAQLLGVLKEASAQAAEALDALTPHAGLDAIWKIVIAANLFFDQSEPWKLAKEEGKKVELGTVLYLIMESLRAVTLMLWPVLPTKCNQARAQMGLEPLVLREGVDAWPALKGDARYVPSFPVGVQVTVGQPLFPRWEEGADKDLNMRLGIEKVVVDSTKAAAAVPASKHSKNDSSNKESSKEVASHDDGFITFDDFAKVKLKLAKVLTAIRVPKSDKLLELSVDVGETEPRTILAGIGLHYDPDALLGKTICVVVNLAPRKLMGRTSFGMVLAAKHIDDSGAEKLSVLFVDKDLPGGSGVQ